MNLGILDFQELKTPIGKLTILTEADTLVACGYLSVSNLMKGSLDAEIKRRVKPNQITGLIRDYFEGDLSAINAIKVRQPGGEFSQTAWRAMRKVRVGNVISYAELAVKAGSPKAVRAAGSACAKNRVAIVVPCHRIIKTDGGLGNYAYGLKAKEWLLSHEGAL
jgi:methylated-DNA-[protein]-cysteine S-methyltransferase